MVRVRVAGGVVLDRAGPGRRPRLAAAHGEDWLHLTTRQNIELHWVEDRAVPGRARQLARLGLSTRSACGHTLRNVMAPRTPASASTSRSTACPTPA